MSEKILEVRQLATSFHTERGWQQAIDGVSFDVYQGEILGIVGESGCGKSVTSQSIMPCMTNGGWCVTAARSSWKGSRCWTFHSTRCRTSAVRVCR